MKEDIPQQQSLADTEGTIYVQTPDGQQRNVPVASPKQVPPEKEAAQTAENTPTKSSGEVTSGEDA